MTPEAAPVWTILIALYREADSVPSLLAALSQLNWPTHQLDVIFACESDDVATLDVLSAYQTTYEFRIVRVPEGDYRVESRFFAGNAAAVTDVHVRAGRLSAVAIDHKAGIARLAFVGSPAADVQWNVSDREGRPIAMAEGLNADIVLVPGIYTARAKVGDETLSATFAIATGEARDILLGN